MKINARIDFDGDGFIAKITESVKDALDVVGVQAVRMVKEEIAVPTAAAGPSKPGEPPHYDTGTLSKSIYAKRAGGKTLSVLVNTDLDYGLIHELGERPFLRPVLAKRGAELAEIFMRKVRSNRRIGKG